MTNRKGFSMVEVIVSIVVVVIVSISSISVIYTSTKIVDLGYDQYWATLEVNNLKESLISDHFSPAEGSSLKFYFGERPEYFAFNHKSIEDMQNNVTNINAHMEMDTYHFSYDKDYKLLDDQESSAAYYRISFVYNKNTGGFTVRAIRMNPFRPFENALETPDAPEVQELYLMDEEIVIGVEY